jgi:hypothetical protein
VRKEGERFKIFRIEIIIITTRRRKEEERKKKKKLRRKRAYAYLGMISANRWRHF